MHSPEDVAYWFFRLNGYLTIRNFIVHPDHRGPQRTDADLLALRFPWRAEQSMVDFDLDQDGRPLLLIVEVKAGGLCRLNGPWTEPAAGNLPLVLRAIGSYDSVELQRAASELYARGVYRGASTDMKLVAVAALLSPELAEHRSEVVQLTWDQILAFILERFALFRAQKAHHPQWDTAGQLLYSLAASSRQDLNRFGSAVHRAFFSGT